MSSEGNFTFVKLSAIHVGTSVFDTEVFTMYLTSFIQQYCFIVAEDNVNAIGRKYFFQ